VWFHPAPLQFLPLIPYWNFLELPLCSKVTRFHQDCRGRPPDNPEEQEFPWFMEDLLKKYFPIDPLQRPPVPGGIQTWKYNSRDQGFIPKCWDTVEEGIIKRHAPTHRHFKKAKKAQPTRASRSILAE
jgi:hypothetical protein